MKTKRMLVASLLFAAVPLVAADRVDTSQLPVAVQRTLESTAPGARVANIRVGHRDGRAIYDIELQQNRAFNPRVQIAEDGELLREAPRGSGVETPRTPAPSDTSLSTAISGLQLDELPRAVQDTIRREAGGRDIAVISAESIDGHQAYVVQLSEPGRNPRVYVGEDGALLRPAEKPPTFGLGTTFAETPKPVQEAIRRELRDGEIVRIDKERRSGEADAYKVSVKDARGTYDLLVTADGRVVENPRASERPPNRG